MMNGGREVGKTRRAGVREEVEKEDRRKGVQGRREGREVRKKKGGDWKHKWRGGKSKYG